jgi:hypothetical protein
MLPNKDLYQEVLGKLVAEESHVGSLYLESVRVDNLGATRTNLEKLRSFVDALDRAETKPDRLVRILWNIDNWIITLPFWFTTLQAREHEDITLAEAEVYTPNVYAQRGNLRFQLLPSSDALMELCLGSDLRVIPAGLIAEMHRTLDAT